MKLMSAGITSVFYDDHLSPVGSHVHYVGLSNQKCVHVLNIEIISIHDCLNICLDIGKPKRL